MTTPGVLAADPYALVGLADLLRLAYVPAFAWAAYRDARTRRIPNALWPPLAAAGLLALVLEAVAHYPFAGYDGRLFLVRVSFSLLFLVPFSVLAYRAAAFGGADAKALLVLAVGFPTTPTYVLPLWVAPDVALLHRAFPLYPSTLGVAAMSTLTNAVLVGAAYVLWLGVHNALAGRLSTATFVGKWTPVERLPERHGSLLDTDGALPSRGLDLDALRMYLRWRGATLADLRTDPDAHRDPESVDATHEPTDGAVLADGGVPGSGGRGGGGGDVPGGTGEADEVSDPDARGDLDEASDPAPGGPTTSDATSEPAPAPDVAPDDPWAAERFLAEIDGTAYGTDAETLRAGLEEVATADAVWVSPGLPFVVPLFVGLVVALTYGDVLTVALYSLGLV